MPGVSLLQVDFCQFEDEWGLAVCQRNTVESDIFRFIELPFLDQSFDEGEARLLIVGRLPLPVACSV